MASLTQALKHSCTQICGRRSLETRFQKRQRVVPARYRIAGLVFNLAALVNREWAAGQLSGLWFRVFKPKAREWVHQFWQQADQRVELELADKTIPVYLWGHGPLVVCMHGWGGSGTQFRRIIPELVSRGYRVASFDAPAHGLNPEKTTHILEFVQTLLAIQSQLGPINTVVGHSFGCLATLLANEYELMPERMVFIAPGLDIDEMFENYADQMGLDQALVERFHDIVGDRMAEIAMVSNVWAWLQPERLMHMATEQGLLIYDSEDEELDLRHFERIKRLWPASETMRTDGLGHFKLLKDEAVIERIGEWLESRP